VLELAGGTGEIAELLAPRVARLISTDLSPGMVEAARRRGLTGVEHRVMDMQAIDLADASVDGVICRFGFMLAPDPLLALREAHRVLRRGGRLAFATWAAAKRNPWATIFGPILLERGLMEPPQPGEPGQFALGEPDQIEGLAHEAGFRDIAVEDVAVEYRFPSWDDYRRVMTSLAASLRQTLAELDAQTNAEVDAAASERFEAFRRGDEYVLPGVSLVSRATAT
jgi:SAM-dependent methyltransferase